MSQLVQERQSGTTPGRWMIESDPLHRMQEMLDQTFGGLSYGWPTQFGNGDGWSPLVDIEERDDAYVLEAEVPGVKREDIQIEQIGNELSISGEFKEPRHTGVMRKRMRHAGKFSYRVALPQEVDPAKVDAKLSDGVLIVRVPKSQKAPRKKIEIKTA